VAIWLAAAGSAQRPEPLRPCAGEIVSAISSRATQPPELARIGGLERWLGRASGLIHRGTEPDVVLGFVRIKPGQRCSEVARTESERVLRAQPFFANARIRVLPQGPDTVTLEVTTEEELRPNVGMRISNGHLTRLRLGTANYGGQAIAVTALYRSGEFYRDGFGIRIADYQPFGRPLVLNVEAVRDPLGSTWLASIREPQYSERQARSWYAGVERRHGYQAFRRTTGRDVSVDFDRTRWLAAAAWRLGSRTRAVFAGPVAAGERSVDRGGPRLVTDTGVFAYDGVGIAPVNSAYTTVRAGAIAGVHRVSYVTVNGFDALTGQQDVRSGVEVLALGARSVRVGGSSRRDILVGGALYAGKASERSLVALAAEGETRRPIGRERAWEGTTASARAAWYVQPRARRVRILSAEFSGGWDTRLPVQLTLAAREVGLRGFGAASIGGARRLALRAEERWIAPMAPRRWDLGAAVFADAGRLWAGQAPFGETTGWQASAGVSLLGATPRGARHVWRVDIAVPLTSAGQPANVEVRASIRDATRFFWRDPADVARVREGPLLSRVLGRQ